MLLDLLEEELSGCPAHKESFADTDSTVRSLEMIQVEWKGSPVRPSSFIILETLSPYMLVKLKTQSPFRSMSTRT